MSDTDFQGRLALITGASAGLGRALALALAKSGAHVIAIARNKDRLERLDDEIRAIGAEATLVPLDITKGDGLDELGGVIFERWKKLDILVANAAMLGTMGPLAHVKPRDWDAVIETNITANFRLIRSFDVLLRAADAGRAVFITSHITQVKRAYWGPYATTKAAVEALATTYAMETSKTSLKVNVIDPGAMRTAMRAEAFPGEDPDTLPAPEEIAPFILKALRPDFTLTGERLTISDLKN